MNIGLNNTLPSLILVYLSSPPYDIGPHPILQLRVLRQLNLVQPRFLPLCFWINNNCFLTKPHKYKSKWVRSSEQGGQASHIHFPIQLQWNFSFINSQTTIAVRWHLILLKNQMLAYGRAWTSNENILNIHRFHLSCFIDLQKPINKI